MYGNDSSLLLDLLLVLVPFFLLIFLFNGIVRKWLKVEKRKLFSHSYVNDHHKKVDWLFRGIFIVLLIIGGIVNISRIPHEPVLFLESWFLLLALVTATEIVRAVMEKRYAENPKAYVFTISQLIFLLILVASLLMTDFWGIV